MIIESGLGIIAQKKIQELNRLRGVKLKNTKYRIIDIGGGKEKHVPDKFEFIDATMDFRDVVKENIKHFSGNINDPFLWKSVDKEVKKNGKYDYCICTHTLEDIVYPAYVLKKINQIAKAGIISFPSKYREFKRFELGGSIRGYSHHRWIITIKNKKLKFFPKVNIVENSIFDRLGDLSQPTIEEVFLTWQDNIEFEIFNNDWLGPSPVEFFNNFANEILNTDEDIVISRFIDEQNRQRS